MAAFLTEYKRMCREILGPLGFRQLGNSHWRVVNDVIHVIFMRLGRGGGWCQLSFGIIPLCLGVGRSFIKNGYGEFLPNSFPGSYTNWDWHYDKKSEVSMQECIKKVMGFIQHNTLRK